MPRSRQRVFDILIHVAILLPFILMVWDAAFGLLGANPIREIQLRTGRIALALLILSLGATPAFLLTRNRWALVLRRRLGLYAFFYACFHFINFIGIDYQFNLSWIRQDIFSKRYAIVGFVAFLLLIPLALTSTRGWIKRLGKNWSRLHRLVYLAGLLAVIHLYWSLKADKRLALVYGGVLIFLLLLRLPAVQRVINKAHFKVSFVLPKWL
jgi:sulfoxide reductase heme-binding subunit YedZ